MVIDKDQPNRTNRIKLGCPIVILPTHGSLAVGRYRCMGYGIRARAFSSARSNGLRDTVQPFYQVECGSRADGCRVCTRIPFQNDLRHFTSLAATMDKHSEIISHFTLLACEDSSRVSLRRTPKPTCKAVNRDLSHEIDIGPRLWLCKPK